MIRRTLRMLPSLGLAVCLAVAPAAAALADGLLEIVAGPGEGARRIVLDRQAFEALPRTTLTTDTPWTENKTEFSGVLLRDLLSGLELPAGDLVARALNDYEARIPAADIAGYDILIADRMDGERMSVRDKGPLWIIYPLDAEPDLRTPDTEAKMVWQLSRLTLD